MAETTTRRCAERNPRGTRCRIPVRDGGACRHHRDTAALRAEVGEWAAWVSRELHIGHSDAEGAVGALAGVRGDLANWSRQQLWSALDACVASLGFAQ